MVPQHDSGSSSGGGAAQGEQPAASSSGRMSQRDLPFLPGQYNKRDSTAPCAAQHVQLLKCYKDASALSYAPCKPEYEAFWSCNAPPRPPHKEPGEGAFWAYVWDEGWPWVKEGAGRLKDALLGGSGGSGGGGGSSSSGGGGGSSSNGSGGGGNSKPGGT